MPTFNFWVGDTPGSENDYGAAGNWSESSIPANDEVVIIPPGTPSILDSLDQAAVKLGGFHVDPGFTGAIGAPGDPLLITLKVNDFQFNGTGIANIQVGVDTITEFDAIIGQCGLGATGVYGLSLASSVIADILFSGTGKFGLGPSPDDTTTRVEFIDVCGAGTLFIGAGVAASAGPPELIISHAAAEVTADCSMAIVDVVKGTYRQRGGLWTTAKIHEGKAYASGSGTYVNTYVDAGGAVYNNENNSDRSFTDIEIADGGTWMDPAATGSYTNIDFPNGMSHCTLDFGRGRRLDVDDIP